MKLIFYFYWTQPFPQSVSLLYLFLNCFFMFSTPVCLIFFPLFFFYIFIFIYQLFFYFFSIKQFAVKNIRVSDPIRPILTDSSDYDSPINWPIPILILIFPSMVSIHIFLLLGWVTTAINVFNWSLLIFCIRNLAKKNIVGQTCGAMNHAC